MTGWAGMGTIRHNAIVITDISPRIDDVHALVSRFPAAVSPLGHAQMNGFRSFTVQPDYEGARVIRSDADDPNLADPRPQKQAHQSLSEFADRLLAGEARNR